MLATISSRQEPLVTLTGNVETINISHIDPLLHDICNHIRRSNRHIPTSTESHALTKLARSKWLWIFLDIGANTFNRNTFLDLIIVKRLVKRVLAEIKVKISTQLRKSAFPIDHRLVFIILCPRFLDCPPNNRRHRWEEIQIRAKTTLRFRHPSHLFHQDSDILR